MSPGDPPLLFLKKGKEKGWEGKIEKIKDGG